MPIYEYRCNECRRKVSIFVRGFSGTPEVVCDRCGGKDLTRLFSTFARVKTDKDVYDDVLGDTQLVNRMMANDPSALVEWSRRMEGSESSNDSEYSEAIERMERGEPVESIMADYQATESGSSEAIDSED
ncbi:MAG: zinc ribbon domain-containing protein [Chloroflexi bacterium]|nr:zinc ribbon domain-containing protein [Chloroflexota bacterium]